MRPVIMFDMDETLLHTVCSTSESKSAYQEAKERADANREAAIKGYTSGSANSIKMAEARNKLAEQYESLANALLFAPVLDKQFSANKDCRVVINPEALTAIATAAQHADIVIFTAASRDYAEDALEKTGLLKFFQKPESTSRDWTKNKIPNNVFCLDESPNMMNTTNTPWVLIDDTPAIGKVKQVYPQSTRDCWQQMVVQINPFNEFNAALGNGLLLAVNEALNRVTSLDWGKRCPISGKSTAVSNPSDRLTSVKYPKLRYCCADHKNKYDGNF